jgi:putative oxidoreductase
MNLLNSLRPLYRRFLNLLNSLQSPVLLALRLYWGYQFMQTGWGKLQDISKPIDYFTQLGIPLPALNAWFVSLLEFGGGILLIFGLASRLISIPLVIDMIVAYIAADREALKSIFSEPDKFMAAAPFTFLFVSALILFFGPGSISLDYLIARYVEKRHGPSPVPATPTISQKL